MLESALEVEMSEHPGYDTYAVEGRHNANSGNGSTAKTVLEQGWLGRGRGAKRPRRHVRAEDGQELLPTDIGVDELVTSLSAKGLTTGAISAMFAEDCGAGVSKNTISKITDQGLAEMTEWQNRLLNTVTADDLVSTLVVESGGFLGERALVFDG